MKMKENWEGQEVMEREYPLPIESICQEEPGPTGCCIHRKALEMSCAIQNQLARILAEFEMTLERDVLQPLNRLSEVTQPPAASPPSACLLLLPTEPSPRPPAPRRSCRPSSSTRKACRSSCPTGTPSRAGASRGRLLGVGTGTHHATGMTTQLEVLATPGGTLQDPQEHMW